MLGFGLYVYKKKDLSDKVYSYQKGTQTERFSACGGICRDTTLRKPCTSNKNVNTNKSIIFQHLGMSKGTLQKKVAFFSKELYKWMY